MVVLGCCRQVSGFYKLLFAARQHLILKKQIEYRIVMDIILKLRGNRKNRQRKYPLPVPPMLCD